MAYQESAVIPFDTRIGRNSGLSLNGIPLCDTYVAEMSFPGHARRSPTVSHWATAIPEGRQHHLYVVPEQAQRDESAGSMNARALGSAGQHTFSM